MTSAERTKMLVLAAVLTALVVILQIFASGVKLGPFSVSFVLVPVVLGAALLGPAFGGWFGLVFSLVVLFSGQGEPFMSINPAGCIVTVLVKGICAGLAAGLIYKLFEKFAHRLVAVIVAAVVCPVVNTGLFLVGCRLFFWSTVSEWAKGVGYESATVYLFLGLAGFNFLFELIVNIVLSPAVLSLINIRREGKR